ncbi:MAG: amidohydrolase family protein [Candidatus Aminicenantales bacterium]
MRNKRLIFILTLALGIFLLAGINSFPQREIHYNYDVLIRNGFVLDGSLNPPFKADLGIKEGKIERIGRSLRGKARKIIDARGLYVTPGFIDLHTHVDRGMYFPENRACLNYLTQGVTTVVVGQCGQSAWPIFEKAEDMINRWTKEGIGPNAALLVGHGTVRRIVMGMENREPTTEELEKMKELVKEAMDDGACGLSTGLIYRPGSFSKTDEVIELVKVIAPYGGIYHSHIRDERDKLLEAVKEAIEISEKSGARAHISHFKVMGRKNWGLVKEACRLIEEARTRGLSITADQYPYRFSSGYPYRSLIPLSAWLGLVAIDEEKASEEEKEKARKINEEILKKRLRSDDVTAIFDYLRDHELISLYKKVTPYFPLSERHQQFLMELPRKRLVSLVAGMLISPGSFQRPENARERMQFMARLKDQQQGRRIRQEVEKYIEEWVGAENIVIGICVEKELEGKSLTQVARIKGMSVADTAISLEVMGAKCIPLQMCEEDIEYIMKKDYVGTGSDGTAPFYGIGLTHIRSYSTFLHKIRKYALRRKAVSLPHVIRSQTSLAAKIMNWNERGWIKPGYIADIAVIDINNIQTLTSISNPHRLSKGVEYLLINGEVVIDRGKWNGKLPGKVITLKR